MKKLTLSKSLFDNVGKVQPLYSKVLRRIEQLNFSLSSSSFSFSNSSEVSNNAQESSVEDDVPYLQPIPKKTYGLSKVEEKDVELVENLRRGNTIYPYSNPYERCRKILAEDMKCNLRKLFYNVTGVKLGPLEPVYFPRHTDILIIGGGILGLSIAYTIREKIPHGCNIIVVDKECTFPPVTTNLGQALLTPQLFTEEEEIPMLKYGAEFFSSFSRLTQVEGLAPFKMPYEPLGTLVLVDSTNAEQVIKKMEALKKHELYNKVLDNVTLSRKFPWLNTKNIIFGSLGMSIEGLIDPWAYLHGLKVKCLNLGVTFVTAEVIDFGYEGQVPFRVVCKLPDGTYNSIDFARCVLACGMEALNLTEMLNASDNLSIAVKLPLQETIRYEYCFYNPEGPGLDTPIVIDSNGTYFRREGLVGHYVAGVTSVPRNDEENDPYHIFQNRVKPFLMERVPKFNDLQLIRGWADVQEFCFSNEMGVLGCHPEVDNVIYALGFSHLGLQYMPAVARAVMEAVLYQEYQTLDFKSFHIENLWRKQHLEEERKRKELLESKKRFAISD